MGMGAGTKHSNFYARHKTWRCESSSRSCAEWKDDDRGAEGFYKTRAPFVF